MTIGHRGTGWELGCDRMRRGPYLLHPRQRRQSRWNRQHRRYANPFPIICQSVSNQGKWWRRGESNPRPVAFQTEYLRV